MAKQTLTIEQLTGHLDILYLQASSPLHPSPPTAEKQLRDESYTKLYKFLKELKNIEINDKMKNLIIVRHGDYKTDKDENDLGLTKKGEDQIKRLGDLLVSNYPHDTHIFSSPMPRAFQSAEILNEILKTRAFPKKLYALVCEYDHLIEGQAEDIHNAVRTGYPIENLVLVSHYAIKDYLEYFLQKQFGKGRKLKEMEKGCAIKININDPNSIVKYIPN